MSIQRIMLVRSVQSRMDAAPTLHSGTDKFVINRGWDVQGWVLSGWQKWLWVVAAFTVKRFIIHDD